MRGDSSPLAGILFVLLSAALVLSCYLMSEAPQPSYPGVESYAADSETLCMSYLGTWYDC